MDRQLFEGYKQRLLAKERELVTAIARYEIDGRQVAHPDTQDLADQANHSYEKESLFQQSNSDRNLLGMVQEALLRAGKGRFGRCVECERPVEAKRLEAVPWARHCVRCQELQEKGLL